MPVHSARLPSAVPRRVILLCTAPGDLVYDPMCGNNVTGRVAEELGRRHIANDIMLASLQGSAFRFDAQPDFQSFPLPSAIAAPQGDADGR